MNSYEITHVIIDNQIGEEYVTTDFTYENKDYSVTFKKSDLEVINSWLLVNQTSLPADLSPELIDALRDDVKKRV